MNQSSIKKIKFNEVCRICLEKKMQMQPIFGAFLDSMLLTICDVKIEREDELPQNLCVQCVVQVSRFYSFKQNCEKTDIVLRTELKERKENNPSIKNIPDEAFLISNNTSAKLVTDTMNDINIIGEITLDQSGGIVSEEFFIPGMGLNQTELREGKDNFEINTPKDGFEIIPKGGFEITPKDGFEITPKDGIEITPKDVQDNNNIFGSELKPEYYSENSNIDDILEFQCSKCGSKFENNNRLERHSKTHELWHACNVCGKSFGKTALRRHLKVHLAIKPHICNVCNWTFSEKSNLRKHMMRHTGELRNAKGLFHLCSVCGRQFKWRSSLSKHFKFHTGEKLISCEYCPKQFTETRTYNVHMLSHTGIRPYECLKCGRKFTQQSTLEKHELIHSGKKPHTCSVCNKSFRQRSYLNIHLRKHTGEKPFSCKVCYKAFSAKSLLDRHSKAQHVDKLETIHLNVEFQCCVCEEIFGNRTDIVAHIKSHSVEVEEPNDLEGVFSCEYCDDVFNLLSDFENHYAMHAKMMKDGEMHNETASLDHQEEALITLVIEEDENHTSVIVPLSNLE